jgi:hypothetical protein
MHRMYIFSNDLQHSEVDMSGRPLTQFYYRQSTKQVRTLYELRPTKISPSLYALIF